jgi:hypothetical protein
LIAEAKNGHITVHDHEAFKKFVAIGSVEGKHAA